MGRGRKRIAIFGIKYYPAKGGTSRVVEALLRYIKDDYEVTIYCYDTPGVEDHISGVHTVAFSEPRIKNIGVFFYFIKCLFHLMFKGNYDLVHVHKTEAALFLPIIRMKYNAIATSHAIPYLNDKWSSVGKLFFHIAERIFVRFASIPTAISQTQCDYYHEKYSREVRHVPNGIEEPIIAGEREVLEFFGKHKIEGDYILFAGRRVIPIKGCHHMIDALNKINYKGLILIAGDMEQMPEYSKQLVRESSNLNVIFLDYVGSPALLNAVINRSKLFIFPSEIEGMSMMLLEVAVLGVPIICSDIPQNKMILDDDHVTFFRSKDSGSLAEKIQWALENSDLVTSKGIVAKEHIKANFTMKKVADQYISLYNKYVSTPMMRHEVTQL